MTSSTTPYLPPGFRFHPTDEELILHYLRNRAASSPCPASIIAEVDIYKFDPWDLPARAMFGEREWYFFTPRDRKYPNGARPNRAASSGYWKATGTDKPITATTKGNENIGVKKALVFYRGKPPKGIKTNWIMHEYRLSETLTKNTNKPFRSSMRLDDWVLCRIYQKSSHLQEDSNTDGSAGRRQDSTNSSSQQSSLNNLPKSFSLTNLFAEADFSLLSRLLETPVETPDTLNQSFINSGGGGSYLLNQFSETESSISHADDGLKRRRMEEEGGSHFHSSKKSKGSWNYTDLGNQFDDQWLLNSHLGLQ